MELSCLVSSKTPFAVAVGRKVGCSNDCGVVGLPRHTASKAGGSNAHHAVACWAQQRCDVRVWCGGRVTYGNTFQRKLNRDGGMLTGILGKNQRGGGLQAQGTVPMPPMQQANRENDQQRKILFHGVHHVGLLCENLERSLEFYTGVLGLEINPDRPDDKLPYRGAWLWIGPEMIHLMELPNPDPLEGRPKHGGRDRHFCVGLKDIEPLEERLKHSGIEYTRSMSGRPAIFFRDPDMNCLECVEVQPWRH